MNPQFLPSPTKRVIVVVATLVSVVSLTFLLTLASRRPGKLPTAVAGGGAQQPESSIIITQFVTGGPTVVGSLIANGSIAAITQYPAPILPPLAPLSYAGRPDLGLYDFRYRPEIKLELSR
jgi:hypothetical protein